ncbi:hypothetical protein F2Q68_00014121 [Brassica cretica]|uniref:C2H2-type domain-containing protein n=1 Tax=Brassica cretica TaxID=69181 RepID=A0A8S9HDM0_BRACR|nr:hypothetical protein F2Q68_00014121 [Brassica cretica]
MRHHRGGADEIFSHGAMIARRSNRRSLTTRPNPCRQRRLASTPAMFSCTLTEDESFLCPADGAIMVTCILIDLGFYNKSAAVDSSGREFNRNRLIALLSAIVLEQIRVSGFGGLFLLRLSLHDPVLPLNIERMEQFKERKFVCKFCSKRFACGKSLGGHIRTHMNKENSADSDEDEHNKLRIDENGGQASYGLRENPKKNKKFVVHRDMIALKHQHQQQLLYCRECGKGFTSSKALCGHMACHSEREKILMDGQSDTEASSSPIRRRSKRAVKHHHNHKADAFVDGDSIMDQSDSSASEIEPEQEETALSLMMLSRDSSFKKVRNLVVNSLAESSDNNSVILETKSSSGEQLKILHVKNVEEFCKKDKLGGVDNGDVLYDSDNSDSGYFRNGPKKLDSDVSVDGFLKNNAFSNKSAMGFNSYTPKKEKSLNRFRNEWSGSGSGRSSTKYDLRQSKRGFPCYGRKKIKYEFTESVYDSGDQLSLETDSCADTNRSIKKIHNSKPPMVKKVSGGAKKKSKGHECPICFRVFKSGQALGGHKRSHFIGSQDHRTFVIQQHHQVAHDMHTLIDLNLPAPIDE